MRTPTKRKGQTLSPDFILSLAIFSIILVLSFTLWEISYNKSNWLYNNRQMQNKVQYTTDYLLNTEGIPNDWNSSNVVMIGLKKDDSSALDIDKIINFKLLNYTESKRLMGLNAYDFFINITDPENKPLKVDGAITGTAAVFAKQAVDNVIKDLLENYYNNWDYYWAGPGTPVNNARYVYLNPNEDELFHTLLDNISSYDTLIIEGENSLTITNDDKDRLQDFVSTGGTIIDIQDKNNAQVINHFPNIPDGESAENSDITGTLIKKDLLFPGKNIGEGITFETKKFRFNISQVDKTIVESDGNPGKCLVCLWHYNNGKIYYMPDGSDNTGNPIDGMDMDGIELTFGNNDSTTSDDIVPIKRLILIKQSNSIKTGIMNFYLYK